MSYHTCELNGDYLKKTKGKNTFSIKLQKTFPLYLCRKLKEQTS